MLDFTKTITLKAGINYQKELYDEPFEYITIPCDLKVIDLARISFEDIAKLFNGELVGCDCPHFELPKKKYVKDLFQFLKNASEYSDIWFKICVPGFTDEFVFIATPSDLVKKKDTEYGIDDRYEFYVIPKRVVGWESRRGEQ